MRHVADSPELGKTAFENWCESPGPKFPLSVEALLEELQLKDEPRSASNLLIRVMDSLHSWQFRFSMACENYIARLHDSTGQSPLLAKKQRNVEDQKIYFEQLEHVFRTDPIFDEVSEEYQDALLNRVATGQEEPVQVPAEVPQLVEFARSETFEAIDPIQFEFIRTGSIGSPEVPLLCVLTEIPPWQVNHRERLREIEQKLDSELAEVVRKLAKAEGCELWSDQIMQRKLNGNDTYENLICERIWGPLADAAASAWLVLNWQTPYAMAAYRWAFDCGDEVSFLHEAYLAGLRLWFARVGQLELSCGSVEDIRALERLCRAILNEVPMAYSRESGCSLLGEKEENILKVAYPLLFLEPAECTIDETELLTQWNANDLRTEFETFDDMKRHAQYFAGWDYYCESLRSDLMGRFIAKDEVRRVLRSTFYLVDHQAERLGLAKRPSFPNKPTVDNVRESIEEIIDALIALLEAPRKTLVDPRDSRADLSDEPNDADGLRHDFESRLIDSILAAIKEKDPDARPKRKTIQSLFKKCKKVSADYPNASSLDFLKKKAGGRAVYTIAVLECMEAAGEIKFE